MSIIKELDTAGFMRRVTRYQETLANTQKYRETWLKSLRGELLELLERITTQAKLACSVEVRSEVKNLEAVVLSLGSSKSGLGEPVGDGMHRDLIKQNGSLVYQQLFNGKIMVMINYPYIEKYGEPQPPKVIAIYRPDELKEPYCMRHLEEFINEITQWEDYDDDQPEPNKRIGFRFNIEQQQEEKNA